MNGCLKTENGVPTWIASLLVAGWGQMCQDRAADAIKFFIPFILSVLLWIFIPTAIAPWCLAGINFVSAIEAKGMHDIELARRIEEARKMLRA